MEKRCRYFWSVEPSLSGRKVVVQKAPRPLSRRGRHSPRQVARSKGLGESSPRPLSRRRDLRFPPCAFASQTSSLRIASLTPCFGVRLFLFPFRLPAPSPSFRPHRNLTSPRLVSGSRHLRPAWCQTPPFIFVRTVISCHLRPGSALPRGPPGGARGALSPSVALFRRPGTGCPHGGATVFFPPHFGRGAGGRLAGMEKGWRGKGGEGRKGG